MEQASPLRQARPENQKVNGGRRPPSCRQADEISPLDARATQGPAPVGGGSGLPFFAASAPRDARMARRRQPYDTLARANLLPISDTCRGAPEAIPGFHRAATRFSG